MAIQLSEKQKREGWQIVKFGELAKDAKQTTKTAIEDGLEFYVGLEHLDPHSLRIQCKGIIAEDNPSFTRLFKPGQILFGKRRCYQKKAAVADFEGICSGDIIVIQAIPGKIVPELLPFIVQSDMFFDWAEKTSSGSLSPRTKWKALAEFEFLLPPLARQKEILEVLEKVEEIILENEHLISKAGTLCKVLLQELISGSKKNCKKRVVPIAKIASITTSPVDKKSKKEEPNVKLCNYVDVYNNREITQKIDFMMATASNKEIEKFSLSKGDVVITKDSETPDDIAVPAYIAENISNLVCGYHLAILKPTKSVNGKYLSYALSSPKARHDFIPYAQGITRFGLSKDAYKKVKIYCPELSEQVQIANILDSIHTQIESLKRQSERYTRKKLLILREFLLSNSKVMEVPSEL